MIALATAVREPITTRTGIELEGLGIGEQRGGGVELGSVHVQCRPEGDRVASRIRAPVEIDVPAVGAPEVEVPGGSEGGEGEGREEGGEMHCCGSGSDVLDGVVLVV